MSKKATAFFIVAVTAFLVTFDVWLAWDDIPGNTFSSRIRAWGVELQWLPYTIACSFGILLTHWFTKRDKDGPMSTEDKFIMMAIMLGIVGGGMGIGLFW